MKLFWVPHILSRPTTDLVLERRDDKGNHVSAEVRLTRAGQSRSRWPRWCCSRRAAACPAGLTRPVRCCHTSAPTPVNPLPPCWAVFPHATGCRALKPANVAAAHPQLGGGAVRAAHDAPADLVITDALIGPLCPGERSPPPSTCPTSTWYGPLVSMRRLRPVQKLAPGTVSTRGPRTRPAGRG